MTIYSLVYSLYPPFPILNHSTIPCPVLLLHFRFLAFYEQFLAQFIPGEGNGNLLQYSCLESPMDRGTWQATVYGVAKSWTWLSNEACTQHSLPNFPFVFKANFICPSETFCLMATLGLHWGTQAFSSCFKQGLLSSCSAQCCCGASLVSQHGL